MSFGLLRPQGKSATLRLFCCPRHQKHSYEQSAVCRMRVLHSLPPAVFVSPGQLESDTPGIGLFGQYHLGRKIAKHGNVDSGVPCPSHAPRPFFFVGYPRAWVIIACSRCFGFVEGGSFVQPGQGTQEPQSPCHHPRVPRGKLPYKSFFCLCTIRTKTPRQTNFRQFRDQHCKADGQGKVVARGWKRCVNTADKARAQTNKKNLRQCGPSSPVGWWIFGFFFHPGLPPWLRLFWHGGRGSRKQERN